MSRHQGASGCARMSLLRSVHTPLIGSSHYSPSDKPLRSSSADNQSRLKTALLAAHALRVPLIGPVHRNYARQAAPGPPRPLHHRLCPRTVRWCAAIGARGRCTSAGDAAAASDSGDSRPASGPEASSMPAVASLPRAGPPARLSELPAAHFSSSMMGWLPGCLPRHMYVQARAWTATRAWAPTWMPSLISWTAWPTAPIGAHGPPSPLPAPLPATPR